MEALRDGCLTTLQSDLPLIETISVQSFDPIWAERAHLSKRTELVQVLRGSLVVHLEAERRQCVLGKGHVVCIPSNCLHRDAFDVDEGLDALFVSFQWSREREFFALAPPEAMPSIPVRRRTELLSLLEGLRGELADAGTVDQLVANCRLLCALLALVRGVVECQAPAPSDEQMDYGTARRRELTDRAKQYLRDNYDQPLRLDDVASALNVSGYYLSHVFSQESNFSLFSYLTNLRIERAKRMLIEEATNISEAACAVGYNDPNYFAKIFRKHVGVSPSEFLSGRSN